MDKHPAYTTPDNTPSHLEVIVLGMGCFWGAEKRMKSLKGVKNVEAGYANGELLRTSYKSVLAQEKARLAGLSKIRNHAEVVKVTFDPKVVSLEEVLAKFWESHNPTQGDRQGNDIGSNYRSGIYFTKPEQRAVAEKSLQTYQQALNRSHHGMITTEIEPLKNYNRAEDYHQRYLEKNPDGYCGLGGLQVPYPKPLQD